MFRFKEGDELIMRFIAQALVGISLVAATPAFAQAAPIAVGMKVIDTSGAAVGTVTAINGDNVVVRTDKHDAALPKTSFSADGDKLLFGMTQSQLDAEIEKGLAAAQASVAAGASVKGLAGTEIGTIDSVTDTQVVIALPSGKKVGINRTGVAGNPDGTVTIGLTAEQLAAGVKTPGSGEAKE
jgi:preprotein translocase subunit YajC